MDATHGGDETQPKSRGRIVQSCNGCRIRKVKCDRVKPCRACCIRQRPSECTYDANDSERHYIDQADAIEGLKNEIEKLKSRLLQLEYQPSNLGSSRVSTEHLTSFSPPPDPVETEPVRPRETTAPLEALFRVISAAPDDVVKETVRDIRNGTPLATVLASRPHTWAKQGSRETKATRTERHTARNELPSTAMSRIDTDQQQHATGIRPNVLPFASPNPKKLVFDPLVEKFIDEFGSRNTGSSGGVRGFRSAAELRAFSPLLDNAFYASSLTIFGSSMQKHNVAHVGHRFYSFVLSDLQKAISDPQRSRSPEILVSAVLMTILERALFQHMAGVLKLLEYRGPESHMFGIEHSLFVDLRVYWAVIAIATRAPTFLAREEWLTIPWSAGTTKKNILEHLLDIMVGIPAFLSRTDSFRRSVASRTLSSTETIITQRMLARWIVDIERKLHGWKHHWADRYPDGQPTERVSDHKDNNDFPIFRHVDLRTGVLTIAPTLVYPDGWLAESMCLYWMTFLILAPVDPRGTGGISPHTRYTYACNICRSLQYYVDAIPGPQVFRIGIPMRTALDYFGNASTEGHFIMDVFHLIGRKFSVPLFMAMAPEMSSQAEPVATADIFSV